MVEHHQDEWRALPNVQEYIEQEKATEDTKQELIKQLFEAKLAMIQVAQKSSSDLAAAEHAALLERQKAAQAHDYVLSEAIQAGYVELAKDQINQTNARADFVQKAALAIGSAYTGVLALSFGLSNGSKPLPITGLAPTLFFGITVTLAAGYLAYVTKPADIPQAPSTGNVVLNQIAQRDRFIVWSRAPGLRRTYLIRMAVVSMGIGIFFLPAPYLDIQPSDIGTLVVMGIIVTLLLPALVAGIDASVSKVGRAWATRHK